jgi:hypothetical protein
VTAPVVLIRSGHHHGRCPQFWSSAVQLGLLRPIKMCPLTVLESDLQAFADGLTVETIRAVNAYLTRYRRKPASPERSRPGRRPGSGQVRKIMEGRGTVPGTGGTGTGAPAGVLS